MKKCCNVLQVFGFNSAKDNLNLIQSYLLLNNIQERGFEPVVIKKANQFVFFKFEKVLLLDIIKFLGGSTRLEFFLKAYSTSKTKGYFLYEWFDDPEKLNNTQLPPYKTFFGNLLNKNSLEKNYCSFQNLIDRGLTSKEA